MAPREFETPALQRWKHLEHGRSFGKISTEERNEIRVLQREILQCIIAIGCDEKKYSVEAKASRTASRDMHNELLKMANALSGDDTAARTVAE